VLDLENKVRLEMLFKVVQRRGEMPETPDLFSEVANMRDELEEQGTMIDALVRTSAAERKDAILEEMQKDSALADVFLLVDGQRSQGEIVQNLSGSSNRGVSGASVSRKLEKLAKDMDLIVLARRVAAGNVYRKTRLDRVLGITRELNRRRPQKTK
jgi:hypothetical protein